MFPAYEGADTFRHGREETPRFSLFFLSLPCSLSLLRNAPAQHPGGNFLVSSMRVIMKIRAGAAELSLIISERLDPRIRLLFVIQFTRRKAIISRELILFPNETKVAIAFVVYTYERKVRATVKFIRRI